MPSLRLHSKRSEVWTHLQDWDSVCGGLVVIGCPTQSGPWKFKSHSESFEAGAPNQGWLMDDLRTFRTVNCVLGYLHVTIGREAKPQNSGSVEEKWLRLFGRCGCATWQNFWKHEPRHVYLAYYIPVTTTSPNSSDEIVVTEQVLSYAL